MSAQRRDPGPEPDGMLQFMPRLVLPPNSARALPLRTTVDGAEPGRQRGEAVHALQTDLSLTGLQEHFAPQLEAQGWRSQHVNVGAFLATSTWTREVVGVGQLRGVLSLLRHGSRDRELSFKVMPPETE